MEAQTIATLTDVVTTILSIVALVVTVIGFFASLKFYRDGVKLQGLANDALIRIEEKAQSIQTQVGGMFDKTLDAAIGRNDKLESSFEALNEQLENATEAIVESAQKKIGAAGDEERKRLTAIVEKQMQLLRARVEETRESAAEVVEAHSSMSTEQSRILGILKMSARPLEIEEVARIASMSMNKTYFAIKRLLQHGYIIQDTIDNRPIFRLSKRLDPPQPKMRDSKK